MPKGIFITFEGPDGGGKTTHVRLLADALIAKGYDIVATKEPGGTETGKILRQIMLADANLNLAKETECLLMLADRAQHVKEILRPALDEGKIVVCDRHKDSTVAYQIYGSGVGVEMAATASAYISAMGMQYKDDFIDPQLTFMLDMPVEGSIARIRSKVKDKIEKRGLDFYQRVRDGFLDIAKHHPERVILLDGTQPLETLREVILIAALDYIEKASR